MNESVFIEFTQAFIEFTQVFVEFTLMIIEFAPVSTQILAMRKLELVIAKLVGRADSPI